MMNRRDIPRRNVLQCGVALGAAFACGSCLSGCSRKADVVAEPEAGKLWLSESESASLLEPDNSLLVGLEGDHGKILLVHTADALYAVSSKCTHRGCDVDYDKGSGHLICPCHGSEFALDGSNLKGPATRPLPRYEVKRERGLVVVTL